MNILNWIYEIRSYATAYTTRLKAWWLIALIWALVAACVVFFYGSAVSFGTWRPFERYETRLYTIWYVVRGRRRDRKLIDAVAEGGEVDPARAAAEDVAELRGRLKTALKLLRKTMGRRSNYALPWYALIGPPGSGKTTALQNSGLRFPLADTMGESVEGVGGTRHCDWWFTDEAILIDTAGRYTAQEGDSETDAAGWRGFLKLLRKHRRRQPLNGAIVMLGMDTLIQSSGTERLHHARVIRRRLRELDEAFGLRVPVYIVLTKADRIAGFTAFFDDMAQTGREQVWGTTLPLPKGGIEGRDLADRFGRAFDALVARLNGLLLERLQTAADAERRAQIFAFPSQLSLIAEPLHEMIGETAAASRFDPPPQIRGIYLASAQQGGSPLDLVTRAASQRFAVDLPRFNAASAGGTKSFFLARLFREVIFNESNLVSTNPRRERRRRIVRYAANGLAATLVLGVTLVWLVAYLRQERMLSETDSRLGGYSAAAATLPFEDVADTDFARADAVLTKARESAQPFAANRTPVVLNAFDQEPKVQAGQANLYERALTHFLLPRILVQLGNTLRAGSGAQRPAGDASGQVKAVEGPAAIDPRAAVAKIPAAAKPDKPDPKALRAKAANLAGDKAKPAPPAETNLQDVLRLYLMLGGIEGLDKTFARERLATIFGRLYPADNQAVLRTSLDGHVVAMLEHPLLPIDLDDTLVDSAKGTAQVLDLGGRWAEAGDKACRKAVERRFPFEKGAVADTALADFTTLFAPDGTFSTFFKANMRDVVDTATKPWRWKAGTPGSDALLKSFENADEIRQAFFPAESTQPTVLFEVTPVSLDAAATTASLVTDGQEVAYSRGSARPLRLTWPSQNISSPAARVSVQPGSSDALAYTGPWALFRLVDAGKVDRLGIDRIRVAYEASGHDVSFEFRSATIPDPFALPALRGFRCPRLP